MSGNFFINGTTTGVGHSESFTPPLLGLQAERGLAETYIDNCRNTWMSPRIESPTAPCGSLRMDGMGTYIGGKCWARGPSHKVEIKAGKVWLDDKVLAGVTIPPDADLSRFYPTQSGALRNSQSNSNAHGWNGIGTSSNNSDTREETGQSYAHSGIIGLCLVEIAGEYCRPQS